MRLALARARVWHRQVLGRLRRTLPFTCLKTLVFKQFFYYFESFCVMQELPLLCMLCMQACKWKPGGAAGGLRRWRARASMDHPTYLPCPS